MWKDKILQELQEIVKELTDKEVEISLTTPKDIKNGDYTSNVAFQLAKDLGKSPLEVAQLVVDKLSFRAEREIPSGDLSPRSAGFEMTSGLEKVQAVAPGFINFYLSTEALSKNLEEVLSNPEKIAGITKASKGSKESNASQGDYSRHPELDSGSPVLRGSLVGKKIMVEFAHPNTHKELHIGHMRTLTTGESIARLFEANGAKVFRANYQGDIGPHVAKAIYGVKKMIHEQDLTLEEIEKWSYADKAHFLGQGYARGSRDYEAEAKEEIDALNVALYKRDPEYKEIYQLTRKWSLDYYDEFYARFYTKFDKLFFEGDLDREAVKIVKEYVGKVFTQDEDGSIVFKGEPYGLHTRVFVTQKGTPTYEGKEVALGFAEYEAFPFDLKVHVVASEQSGYFQVVFKAMEMIDPEKFEGHEYHLSMGMVQLVGRKMSSRTGDVLTVDELLNKVKEAASAQFKEEKVGKEERERVLEQVTIGAVKHAILKGGVKQDAKFDIETSVSLDGNSGPYVQYTYTRTQSVLTKSGKDVISRSEATRDLPSEEISHYVRNDKIQQEESELMRKLVHFSEVVESAALTYSPNVVTEYLFELAQLFNLFYQKYRILNAESEGERMFRLNLTAGVGIVLKKGLNLLGIQAPQRM